MQLPKYSENNKYKLKLRICKEPGCGIEFLGNPIAKYCETHRDIKARHRRKRKHYDDGSNVPVEMQKVAESVEIMYPCALEGCDNSFRFTILPKMKFRPKFCEEHRNTFKRDNFIRNRRLAA